MGISRRQFDKLRASVEYSRRQMETPRKKRVEAIKDFVGIHYNDGGSEKRVPVNYLALAVNIYARRLMPRAPRVLITAQNPSLQVSAKEMELAINQVPAEVDLTATLRQLVMEAMFSAGIVKVGIHKVGQVLHHDYGESFVDVISLDDYIVDMSARNYDTIQFEGNDYTLEIETVKQEYDIKDGDLASEDHCETERASDISSDSSPEEYKDRIRLRDLWLPNDNKVITYIPSTGKLLREIDWDGPENGPYYKLGFTEVPGNVLPLPPAALWRDLHELANVLFRKLSKQADSHKKVTIFQGDDDQGVENLKIASDGEGVKYQGSKPEELEVGGIDQLTLAFFLQVKDQISYLAGNLDSLGGLAPMTDTVGQDKLLSEAASSQVKSMVERTVTCVRDIFKALAWNEWTDPVRQRKIVKKVPGTDVSVSSVWSAETREGDFIDYNFDIDVFSMQDDTPADKTQKLGAILQQYIFPMLPMLQEQGIGVDFAQLIKLLADYSNMPELESLVRVSQGQIDSGNQVKGNPIPSMKPAHTTRTYERVNRPGATRHGKDAALSQLLAGSNGQNSETMSLFRGVS